jgi:PadR family transcriptional regulator
VVPRFDVDVMLRGELEARGLIASEWGSSENNRKAKFYKITAAGRRQLVAERKAWEQFSGAIELILRDA